MCFPRRKKEKQMEFRDFVTNTLTQLVDSILTAQEYAKDKGCEINPSEGFPSNFEKMSRTMNDQRLVQIIEFDVAITVAENKQLQGGIGIVVPELNIGYQGEIANQKSAVSRVQFSIPVILPTQDPK